MKKHFTLAELLTVTAIIGTAAALLLPAINGAQATARRSVCQDKLRALGVGIQLYANNNDSAIPSYPRSPNSTEAYNYGIYLHTAFSLLARGGYMGDVYNIKTVYKDSEWQRFKALVICPDDKVNHNLSEVYGSYIQAFSNRPGVWGYANDTRMYIGRDLPGNAILYDVFGFENMGLGYSTNHSGWSNYLQLNGAVKGLAHGKDVINTIHWVCANVDGLTKL